MSVETPGVEREPLRESLDSIRLADYENLPPEVEEWLHSNEKLPEGMKVELEQLDPNTSIRELLHRILEAYRVASEGKKTPAQSLEESRYTPVHEVVDRGLESCGAHVRLFGVALREKGIPLRFVDGRHVEGDNVYDHAWLDIYAPQTKTWVEADVRAENFEQDPRNRRSKVFHDWEEMKAQGR